MQNENPNVFVPQQFENPANPMVHRHHTGLEILEQVKIEPRHKVALLGDGKLGLSIGRDEPVSEIDLTEFGFIKNVCICAEMVYIGV